MRFLPGAVAFVFAAAAFAFEGAPTPTATLTSASFRMPVDRMLPQTETYQVAVFSGAISGIPRAETIDRVSAPPLVAILREEVAILDRATGALWRSGRVKPGAAPGAIWQPGKLSSSATVHGVQMDVEQFALRETQGFVLKYTLRNQGGVKRDWLFATAQAPSLRRPEEWGYAPQYYPLESGEYAAAEHVGESIAAHSNAAGTVAFGLNGAVGVAAASVDAAIEAARTGKTSQPHGTATALARNVVLPAGGRAILYVAFALDTSSTDAVRAVRGLLANPEHAIAKAGAAMDADIRALFSRLPVLQHPDPRVMRFYQTSAMQLLYARWRLPGKLVLDPWYATLGLDSGGMNCYMWDIDYNRVPLALFDPAGMRAVLLAFLSAPLARHYSIEPIRGRGVGPFYAYNPYSYVVVVDTYLRQTGDRALLKEVRAGKSVLEWLVAMAEFGEKDRDPDSNGLLDYGDDHNLLEIKTTGTGPGYIHEVPSPNAERAYCYETVADILAEEDPRVYAGLIERFRRAAGSVRHAVNSVLWLEREGWYGTRQANGQVAPVYSIQIFDLLRVPGIVSRDRAQRLAAHLNDDEFLGPWGVRSLSRRDRLWDWRDHDWSGPMTYIGDAPQLVADLFHAGLVEEAWRAWERILWWPEHLAIWPQGVANDDYSQRVPESARFGGRISAGLINEMAAAAGTETVIRGLFGVQPGRDASIGFSCGRRTSDPLATLVYPFRGRTWTVTQSAQGLDARRDDGLAATLARQDGSMRFATRARSVEIEASTRGGGKGQLKIALPFLLRHCGVDRPERLAVRVGPRLTAPRFNRDSLILEVSDIPAEGVRININWQ